MVIWRAPGRAVNGSGTTPSVCDERAHMRQADPTLTGAETRPRRSLEELQFVVAAVERLLESASVVPMQGHTTPSAVGADGNGYVSAAAPITVTGASAGAIRARTSRPTRPIDGGEIHRHAALRGDGRRSGREPGVERRLAERHHVHGACRHDDLLGADVRASRPVRGRRPSAPGNPHHVDAVARIQRHHAAPRAFGIGRCLRPASAATNDRDLDLDAPDGDHVAGSATRDRARMRRGTAACRRPGAPALRAQVAPAPGRCARRRCRRPWRCSCRSRPRGTRRP